MKRSNCDDERVSACRSSTGRLVWGGDGRVRAYPLVETTLPAAESGSAPTCSSATLASRLRHDGYLFVRGLFSREAVLDARAAILDAVSSASDSRDTNADSTCGRGASGDADKPMSLLGRQDIAALPAVVRVLESPKVAELLQSCTGAPQGTDFHPVPYKWLRAVGPGLFTGVHMDRVYFPDIDPLTHTCWIPLGDVPVGNGAMMICEGAHPHGDRRFTPLRERYLLDKRRSGTREGRQNGTDSGWYTSNAAEVTREFGSDVRWLTANMRAGDVVILPMETLHCTAANMEAKRHRISCDVRWVPLRGRSASEDDAYDDSHSDNAALATQRRGTRRAGGQRQRRQRT